MDYSATGITNEEYFNIMCHSARASNSEQRRYDKMILRYAYLLFLLTINLSAVDFGIRIKEAKKKPGSREGCKFCMQEHPLITALNATCSLRFLKPILFNAEIHIRNKTVLKEMAPA